MKIPYTLEDGEVASTATLNATLVAFHSGAYMPEAKMTRETLLRNFGIQITLCKQQVEGRGARVRTNIPRTPDSYLVITFGAGSKDYAIVLNGVGGHRLYDVSSDDQIVGVDDQDPIALNLNKSIGLTPEEGIYDVVVPVNQGSLYGSFTITPAPNYSPETE